MKRAVGSILKRKTTGGLGVRSPAQGFKSSQTMVRTSHLAKSVSSVRKWGWRCFHLQGHRAMEEILMISNYM